MYLELNWLSHNVTKVTAFDKIDLSSLYKRILGVHLIDAIINRPKGRWWLLKLDVQFSDNTV